MDDCSTFQMSLKKLCSDDFSPLGRSRSELLPWSPSSPSAVIVALSLLASLLSPSPSLLPAPELQEWVYALEAELCKRRHLQRCFLLECHCLTSGSCYSCVNEMSEMNFTV